MRGQRGGGEKDGTDSDLEFDGHVVEEEEVA